MSVKVFVDSTTLLYARDATAPLKQRVAERWLEKLESQNAARVSVQVLREYYNVLTKPRKQFKVPIDQAALDVENLYTWLPDERVDDRFEDAWAIQRHLKYSWFDSLLLAAAIHADCSAYITEDLQDGQMVHGMRIVNPFNNDPDHTLAILRADNE